MSSKHLHLILSGMLLVSLTGCYTPHPPTPYQTLDTLLTSGQLEYYGAFYKALGVDYDVISLDLYSKGLGLNADGMMEGVGTNLYISDIFISTATPSASKTSDYLIEDTYQSDSVPELSHFLRGLDYDGSYGGSYVLLMSESGYKVYPITEGEMTVTYIGDTLVLDGKATLRGLKQTYPFHYRDILPIIHRER